MKKNVLWMIAVLLVMGMQSMAAEEEAMPL